MANAPDGARPGADVADMIALMADPGASDWLRSALSSALDRDPFDAERDALTLAALLTRRLDALVARHFAQMRNGRGHMSQPARPDGIQSATA